jgi:hypothetical protein
VRGFRRSWESRALAALTPTPRLKRPRAAGGVVIYWLANRAGAVWPTRAKRALPHLGTRLVTPCTAPSFGLAVAAQPSGFLSLPPIRSESAPSRRSRSKCCRIRKQSGRNLKRSGLCWCCQPKEREELRPKGAGVATSPSTPGRLMTPRCNRCAGRPSSYHA